MAARSTEHPRPGADRGARLQRVLVGLVLAGLLAVLMLVVGAQRAEAHHSPCPTTLVGDGLASWTPAGCRNFVVDSGLDVLMDRAGLLANESLYTAVEADFTRNFLWYSEETSITITDPSVRWTACRILPGTPGACPVTEIKSDLGPQPHSPGGGGVLRTFHDIPSVTMSVFEFDGFWVAKSCGNYVDGRRAPVPIPKLKTTKFHDLDRDGVRDPGEGPLAGFEFRVVRESSLVGQPPMYLDTVTSNGAGVVLFALDDHGPGRYYFEEVVPSGWTRTTPARRYVDVPFGAADRILEAGPFGNVENRVDVEKDVSGFGLINPPASLEARTPTVLTVRAVLTNNGPAGPIEVEEILTVTGPDDCVIDPVESRTRLVLGRAGTPSATQVVDAEVTVTCDQPSFHEFTFKNRIEIVTPGVTETDPGDNTAEFSHTFEVFAEADLAVTDVGLDCPSQTTVGTAETCVLTSSVVNLGPYGAIDATASFDFEAPADCTAVPDGPADIALGFIDADDPVPVSRSYTVTCSYRSFHDFTGTVSAAPVNIHVIDDQANNSRTATALIEVFHDADLQATNIALHCNEDLGEPDFTCTALVTVVNNGPAPDVEAETTVTIATPSDCTADPSSAQSATTVLEIGVALDLAFAWDLTCTDGDMLHPFAFVADVAPSVNEPHAVDEPGAISDDWTVPFCMPTVNPDGRTEPEAPGEGGQGQNQDGFYEFGAKTLTGLDVVWIEDTGTGTVFGPFPSGTRVKYVEANGAQPSITPMGGNNGPGGGADAVDYQIRGQGDAAAVFFDEDGNVIRAMCLVPPAPQ